MDLNTCNIAENWEKTLLDTSKKLIHPTTVHYTSLLATIKKIEELETLCTHYKLTPNPL